MLCLISAVQQSHSVIHIYILFHYDLSLDIEYSSLCYTVGPCCLSKNFLNIKKISPFQLCKNFSPDHLLTLFGFRSFIFFLINLFFIFGCVGSSFLCEGFLQLRQAGATLHRGARASHCRGLSCCGAQAPDTQAQ